MGRILKDFIRCGTRVPGLQRINTVHPRFYPDGRNATELEKYLREHGAGPRNRRRY
jgi:hypothetical protein